MADKKPWIVIGILNEHPQLITRRLASGESILMLALILKSNSELIKKQVQLVPEEELAILVDNFGNTTLHKVESTQLATLLAMKSPNLLVVRNNLGWTPLMMAIGEACSFECITKMIEMTPDEGLYVQDNIDGSTALHMVVMNGNIELAELLLTKCQSSMHKCNNLKMTPFMAAVVQPSSSDMIKKLFQFTSSEDLAMQDKGGNTVLHIGCVN